MCGIVERLGWFSKEKQKLATTGLNNGDSSVASQVSGHKNSTNQQSIDGNLSHDWLLSVTLVLLKWSSSKQSDQSAAFTYLYKSARMQQAISTCWGKLV